jgi:hypothetical protein
MHTLIYSGLNAMTGALSDSLRAAGHTVGFREPRFWSGERERCDMQFVASARHPGLLDRTDVPTIILDWGYLNRVNDRSEAATGHWQMSLDGLNRIPPFACPSDRFDGLGLTVAECGGDPSGYVLLIGQMPGDAAHAGTDHRQWLMDQLKRYDDIVYRPHPRGGIDLPGVRTHTGALSDALRGARLIVTYNSNTGHDALLAGIPVVCDPCAAYAPLSGETLPSKADREAYFHRVAYGQWTADEVRSGSCLSFLMNHLLPNKPMDLPELGKSVPEFGKPKRRTRKVKA